MFKITDKDIAELDDTNLRELVASLCTAELWRNHLPVSSVTAGGNQTAPDGGSDVRVELEPGKYTDFIRGSNTVFQVKAEDMPPSKILKEMQPGRSVRPIIKELADKGGAYIIVSSKGSVTDSSLRKRKMAMREAVDDLPKAADLLLDFYDQDRLAGWVNLYPGVALWVRKQLGKPLQGWQPYGCWSAMKESLDAEYLLDGKSILHDSCSPREGGLTIVHGINRIREILLRPSGVARLIGLSGLGKTRLAQALFDERIGTNPLHRSQVIYTDLAEETQPPPRDLINDLVQSEKRAIVIIDNCLPETHKILENACAATGSSVSLLTVEYDVGEDFPERTDVFRLEAASNQVIEQLVARRMPHISQVDRHRIAELSGGNARIALGVAGTVEINESLAAFSDKDLFIRLFHQRNSENTELLQAAEACSLVYSFDGETTEGGNAELPILAKLAGLSVEKLYRHISELKRRDLLQKRSKWRAILPHALANVLASKALNGITPSNITAGMTGDAPARLRQSFSRRLGYLHNCETAQKIVTGWLAEGGLLGDVGALQSVEFSIFHNVAPVVPTATLDALDRAITTDADLIIKLDNKNRNTIALLLRSLAYDAALFHRAVMLLAKLTIAEPVDNNRNATRNLFKNLFHLRFSGTKASAKQRLAVIYELLKKDDSISKECGLYALDDMLETVFDSLYEDFSFGARPRDFGWQPTTRKEVSDWYVTVIQFTLERISENSSLLSRVCSIFAAKFHGLWSYIKIYEDLEMVVKTIRAQGFWREGWDNINKTIRLDAKHIPQDVLQRLMDIEKSLQPGHLLDEARAYVLSSPWDAVGVAEGGGDDSREDLKSSLLKANQRTEAVGREVASNPQALAALLPEFSQGNWVGRHWSFGIGLAEGAGDIREMWKILVQAIASIHENNRNVTMLGGFLSRSGSLDPDAVAGFLDDAISKQVLMPWLPYLQCSVGIDKSGVNRLLEAAKRGDIPAWMFSRLAGGRATDPIPSHLLRRLLMSISKLPGGYEVAVEILWMKLDSTPNSEHQNYEHLIKCGRDFLLRCAEAGPSCTVDYKLANIVESCLTGLNATECAKIVCEKLVKAFSKNVLYAYNCISFLKSLFQTQPIVALTAFLDGGRNSSVRWIMENTSTWSDRENLLGEVPLDVLIDWVNIDTSRRFPLLASVIPLFDGDVEGEDESLSQQAMDLINVSPDKIAVLSCYDDRFRPSSWSGSLANALERRRLAIKTLASHSNPIVVDWAKELDRKLEECAVNERKRERARSTDERFE